MLLFYEKNAVQIRKGDTTDFKQFMRLRVVSNQGVILWYVENSIVSPCSCVVSPTRETAVIFNMFATVQPVLGQHC